MSTDSIGVTTAGRAAQVRVVVGAMIGMTGGFTTLYFTTQSQFVGPITQALGWSRAQFSLVAAVAMLGSAFSAPAAGRLAMRYGPRPVIAVSSGLLAAGFVALSRSTSSAPLMALVALLMGILAVATTASGYLIVVPRFFDRRLGLALGVAAAGAGLGTAVIQVVTGAVIESGGWRSAYLMLAVLTLVLAALALAIGYPPGTGALASATEASAATGGTPRVGRAGAANGLTVPEALRTPRVVVMLACIFATAGCTLGFAVHIIAFIEDRGITAAQASGVAALAGIGVTVGRLISGALMDRVHAPRVGAIVFLVTAVGFVAPALATSKSLGVYGLSAMIGGFAVGMESDLIPFLVRRYTGMRAYPEMLGVAFGAYALGGAAGPVLFGLCFDQLGSYSPALWSGIVLFVLAALGLQTLGPYQYPDHAEVVAVAPGVLSETAARPS